MDKVVTTTDTKVLEAAKNCITAKRTLEILFPDVFKKELTISIGGVYRIPSWGTYILTNADGVWCLTNLRLGSVLCTPSKEKVDVFGIHRDDAEYLGQANKILTIKGDA